MKIKETIERECCDPIQGDLKPYMGKLSPKFRNRGISIKFCVHCGQLWYDKRRADGIWWNETVLERFIP